MDRTEEPDLFISFKLSSFLRSLSYRDFLTSFSLVILFRAICSVIDFYSSEEFFKNITALDKTILLLLLMPLNHIIYKAEHNRSNNFIGRAMHDLIFFGLYWLINIVYSFLMDARISLDLDLSGILPILFGITTFLMLFELGIAILKRLLNFFKWQIF